MSIPAETARGLRLAFIDMSGTTFHDNGIMERAFERTVAGLGVDPASERFQQMLGYVRDTLGQSKAGVLEQLFAGEPDRVAQAVRAFEQHLDELLATEGVRPVEGAEQAVTELREAGLMVCLATGYNRHSQNTILEKLGWMGLADLSLCPSDAGRGRPWPDMILTAVLALDLGDVREVMVVGDTAADVQAGLRAGSAAVVGVRTGAHDAGSLREAGAHVVVDSIRDVPALLGAVRREGGVRTA
ncbi:putative haloacid dehalogenase-like hydrolase [Kocuria dechangensis]|uniref:Haloacid dehalogenase-like hydrolase n=1 Tax=Kocuria dechangensis TaxID=1176249 RepID=A0A917LW91_9MICC|nr:HAD-IA family hydrolase [Kocuria dechangensis]GGG61198.1 putative haloacid dehalogenase-like hydrolase [Kocuria dechangensis]